MPLESMLAKTFQICPSMLTNPLNFSPNALTRSAELFSRYQTQCRLNQLEQKAHDAIAFDENGNSKNFLNNESKTRKSKLADTRKIDKIAENLRSSTKDRILSSEHHDQMNKHPLVAQSLAMPMPLDMKTATNFNMIQNRFGTTPIPMGNGDDFNVSKAATDLTSAGTSTSTINDHGTGNTSALKKSLAPVINAPQTTPPCPPNPKPTNSKLYATCFICHKQLSNQYNLRVHLETHQNVR